MDLPPIRHHRYVPFSDNPTFYQPQPYRLPPPPPLPTISHVMPSPPPATHYLSLPLPPPLPPPVQPHFTFRPSPSKARSPHSSNFIPRNLVNHPRQPPPPPSLPRISSYHHNSRNPLQFDDNSRFCDPWPDLPPHFTGPPEHHNHHRPSSSSLRPQTGSYSNDFQRNLRFRDEHVDERFRDDVSPQLPLWGHKEIVSNAHNDVDDYRYSYTGRGRYEQNSNKMDRDFVSADSQGGADFSLKPSRNFELNMRNYELYEEDLRWRVSSFVTDREYGNNNGLSLPLWGERQGLFTSGYEDVSKYKDIRVGEKRSAEFFNRSPGKKQLHKKSALERIQLGKTNNKRNKRYDRSYLSKSYHDESNSSGGSFKGKEKDVFSCMERKMEEERENSPVELDVSFKSNALVAKAIKAAPNPEVGSSRNLMHGYRKIRRLEFSESPGAKLSEHLDETDSADYFDKDRRESAKNAISDKTDSPTHDSHHSASLDECQKSIEKATGLHHSASPGQCKKSEEKVSVVRTESCLHGSDNPSDSDEDSGQLAKKIRISASDSLSAGDSQPCSSELAENTANKESPKLVESVQNVQDVSFDGTIDGTSRKRNRVPIPLPSKDDHEHTTLDNLYADCPPQAILLDEGLSNSPDSGSVSAVASKFILDVLPDERVKSYSQKVSDLKKDNVDTKSRQLLLPQSSAMIPVLQNSGDAYTCEAADHAEICLRDCYSGWTFDKVVEHSCQDEPLPFENGPGWVIDTLKGNALKENKIHDVQMEAYASRNEECITSSSEQRLCRMSEKIDVADSMNANTEESSANKVSASEANDVIEGSSNLVSPVGNSVFCPLPKLEDSPKENITLINSTVYPHMASRENSDNCVTFINQKAPCGDDNCEINLPYMDNIASLSENLSLHVDVSCVFSTNSADTLVSSIPEALFDNISSSEVTPCNPLLDRQNSKSRQSEISNGLSGEAKIFTKSPASGVETVRPPSLRSKADAKLSQALTVPVNTHKVFLLSQNKSKVIQNSSSLPDKHCISNNQLTNSMHGGFPGRTSANYSSVGKASAINHVSGPRTWHRTGTASQSFSGSKSHVSSQSNSKRELARVQSSYIRKGNSLVRKPSPVGAIPQVLYASGPTLHRLTPAIDNLKKARGSRNSVNVIGPLASATMGGFIAGPERPKTPPLSGPVKSLNCKPADRGYSACSMADPFRNHCPGETFDLSNSSGNMDVAKCTEDGLKHYEDKEYGAGSSSNLNGQSKRNEKNSGKKVTYVKRKSSQLIAASNSSCPSLQSSEMPQELLCEGYYKRRKNQLIRTSVEDNIKQRVVIPGKCLSSQRLETAKITRNKSSRGRQNGFAKKKFSSVWTPHGTLSSKKDGNSGHFRRVRPFLFPWKRATYWSNFKHSLSSMPNDNLSSAISRKLLLSQKSDTIYKRSFSGFSLRRSKVLGFYGRSLKWSKSIEKNSKKANEDAALAVVAAEKRKHQQNVAAFTPFKSRNYVSRERIFRIGSDRYRMDPTGKALQRISDESPSCSEDQPEKTRKKSCVPRRLLIGNDAYVRTGNGNKLVRDPKERTRILANEKVRWSLHTARLRLARKKKYCQFFTKFGKCNKDDKRCPYIHDPTKILVCTKFLNGCCLESNCKLTHKVIPERMQDCSYFLQGLCSNENCPYRHVNVNPKSPICEDFLRGYCADENECRKKHTYVCPVFEVTGNCQQGTNCKLHHPKIKKKRIKSKASSLQKNVRGRYFGAGPVDIANSGTAVPRMMIGECNDQIFSQDGKYADFISLADSDEAMEEEAVDPRVEPSCDNDREEPSDIQVDEDPDECVKPIRIMKKKLVLEKYR